MKTVTMFDTELRVGDSFESAIDVVQLPFRQAASLLRDLGRRVTIVVLGSNADVSDVRLTPDCEIWAVEPLPDCVAVLRAAALKDPNLHVVACAVGERDDPSVPFLANAEFSVTSSIRPPTGRGYGIGIHRTGEYTVNVELARVDTLVAKGLLPPRADLVVLDVQGHEREVLLGGPEFFKKSWLSLVEVTFEELYHGQVLEPELNPLLASLGHELARSPFSAAEKAHAAWTDAVYINEAAR